jgi:Fe-S-cluster containining protein
LTEPHSLSESVTADVELGGDGWHMRVKLTVPTGPTRMRQLLPMVQDLTNTVVDLTAKAVEEQGDTISCKKGCGACCRQLVPISKVEAQHIRDLVEGLPEPRRSEIRARFSAARRKLEAAGLLEKLLHWEDWAQGEGPMIGIEYFRQGVACPFLEEECCSIHPDRPLACREYLVTSPAENCSRPTAETVKPVRIPLKIWTSVARMDDVPPGARYLQWIPLILAPEWAGEHSDESAPRPGPELVHLLIENLARKEIPMNLPPQVPFAASEAPASPTAGL